jgi:hypothetical protein
MLSMARVAAALKAVIFGCTGHDHQRLKLVSDSVLTPKSGLRGVHEIFQYRVGGGPLQTFDQTAYTNKEGSKVYVMLLRCSIECYQARRRARERGGRVRRAGG